MAPHCSKVIQAQGEEPLTINCLLEKFPRQLSVNTVSFPLPVYKW
jgi:hypothetical protein